MTVIGRLIALIITAASGVLLHTASTKQRLDLLPQHHASLVHLLATCLSTGLQLWTTFGFGIIAFKTLPRHTFGHLQSKLFPIYFVTVSVCTSVQLVMLRTMSNTPAGQFQFKVSVHFWKLQLPITPPIYKGVARGAGWCTAQSRRVWYGNLLHGVVNTHHPYITHAEPATTSVMKQRHVFEKQHSGTAGGPSSAEMKELKAQHPQYKALCSRFGAYHGLSSLANLVTLAACLTHVWYLSTRLAM